ncbi:MAG: VOC family protein [Flavobacteriaceae bacterium]|nr:VOC family protein [Flavobacteriaceae bacterium]
MKNAINWFEIPVRNLKRSKKFYETILGEDMELVNEMGMKSAFFPAELKQGGIAGCITEGKGYKPSTSGSLVYLNGGKDLSTTLSKVVKAGGKIVLPKTSIGKNGFMAHFTDVEGNKVGIHSSN